MSHFVAYILQFQEIIVYKIPPGGRGVYSQPKVYNVKSTRSSFQTTKTMFKQWNCLKMFLLENPLHDVTWQNVASRNVYL